MSWIVPGKISLQVWGSTQVWKVPNSTQAYFLYSYRNWNQSYTQITCSFRNKIMMSTSVRAFQCIFQMKTREFQDRWALTYGTKWACSEIPVGLPAQGQQKNNFPSFSRLSNKDCNTDPDWPKLLLCVARDDKEAQDWKYAFFSFFLGFLHR